MSKILYAAGTYEHIRSFHLPYIEALRKDGHTVLTMASGADADFDIKFQKKILSFRNILCIGKIKKILKSEKFDVIILNTTLAAFNVRAALPKKNRPRVINIVHGYMFTKEVKSIHDRIFCLAERVMAKKTDHILIMNGEDKIITDKYKLCMGNVYMTRGMGAFVPEAKVSSDEIRADMNCRDKYVISFVGELYKAKNQRLLICALPEIKLHIPNAVLWLIGTGAAYGELHELAEKLSVSDSVFFTGKRKNPCDFIRASDLYISASYKEGLPFNIIEALGCEKTVIASDVKGNRDIIEDGKSGFLFPISDMDRLISLVSDVHNGTLCLDPENMKNTYLYYSKENVFPETYSIIKELSEN